jgi:drug/metabolite transporter (DMT)-like permease
VAILSGLSSFLFEDWKKSFNPTIILSKDVLIALVITSIFATALAFFIQTNFQKYTSPIRVALIFAMEPVFAAITGYFWANERLSYSALIGCCLIFAGMIFTELPTKSIPFLRKVKSYEG